MMTKRGRPKKPTSQLRMHGTFREDRRFADEPTPDVVIPERPKFLTGEAKKEWNRIAPLLAKMKCLTEWDRAMLAAYCYEWGVYVLLARKIKKFDVLTVTTSNGNVVQNPLLFTRNRALKNCKQIATEFGMTPSSRTRLAVDEKGNENAFMDLLKRSRNVS